MEFHEFRKRLGAAAEELEGKWRSKLADMIRIDSQSGNEAGMSAFVMKELDALGVESESFDVPADIDPCRTFPDWLFRNRPNVAGVIKGGAGAGRSLILNCHLDMQPVHPREFWKHDPFGAEIEDEKIYGRGALDDKAGVAVVLFTLEILKRIGLRTGGDLISEFSVDDETTGLGSLVFAKKGYTAEGAIIVDGTNLDNAFYAHPGHILFKIEISGAPTTSASAFRALNPLSAAKTVADALYGVLDRLRASGYGEFEKTGQPVNLNLYLQECGFTTAAVPARAVLGGSMSFCPPWTHEKLRPAIVEAVESAWRAEFSGKAMPPRVEFAGYMCDQAIADPQSELAGILRGGAMEMHGIEVAVLPMRGYADLRHFIDMTNGNCMLYGPGGGGGTHIPDEYYELGDMRRCAEILAAVIYRWCGLYPAR